MSSITTRVPAFALELPRLDGEPRRSLACVNMRREEKQLLDMLQAWWSARTGRALGQADTMSLLLKLALESPAADLPPGLTEREE